MAKLLKSIKSNAKITAVQYNDPAHNYLRYWDNRQYEHESEVLAIRRLLKGRHFGQAVDIGGGYGRLSVILQEFCDKVILAEPSSQQLDLAKVFLKNNHKISQKLIEADNMPFSDNSIDLVAMIRVMHHIPRPAREFKEIARVLKPDGVLLLEVANYANIKNRLKLLLKGRRLPLEPVDIRSDINKRKNEIAFVNHNPNTVKKQLAHANLKVEAVLSVSNLRSTKLKSMFSKGAMLTVEKYMQPLLAKSYFGPSIFILARKK